MEVAGRPTITLRDLRERYPDSGLRHWTRLESCDGSRIIWESYPFEPTHRLRLRQMGANAVVLVDYVWLEESTPISWAYLPQATRTPLELPKPSYAFDGRRWQSLWSNHRVDADPITFCWRSPPRRSQKGYVYFIQAGDRGPIKIGWSCEVSRRLGELQTANAARLVLLGYLPGTQEDERAWHARFADVRLEAEWFRPSQGLLDAIAQISP